MITSVLLTDFLDAGVLPADKQSWQMAAFFVRGRQTSAFGPVATLSHDFAGQGCDLGCALL